MSCLPIGMIMSAGFGTRLLPLTKDRPKVVMDVAGRPVIKHLVNALYDCGIREIIINLHYLPEDIVKALKGMKSDLKLYFLIEKEILGTAGALRNALHQLNIENREIVVLHGDIVCNIKLSDYFGHDKFCSLLCAQGQEVEGYVGSVGVDGGNKIIELGQYFSSGLLPAKRGFFTGVHFLSSNAAKLIKNGSERCLVSEVYAKWLNDGRDISAIVKKFYFSDLGTPKRLHAANMNVLKNSANFDSIDILKGFQISGRDKNIFLGCDVAISKRAKIVGPVIVSDKARIESGAIIGPNAVVGSGAQVGGGAKISNSLVMSRTKIEKDEVLDCVVAVSSDRVEVMKKN